MKIILFLLFLGMISCLHMRNHFDEVSAGEINPSPLPEQVIVGGFSGRDVDGPQDLGEGEKQAEEFIESSLSEIEEYSLYHVEEQVVAGMNYCFSYRAKDPQVYDQLLGGELELCVWSKPWENNFFRFQTPDGRIFTNLPQPVPQAQE